MEIIEELNAEGITVVLITHFMEEALEADRVIVLRNGKILADKSPKELFADAELVGEAGLEMPPVIELRDRLELDKSIMSKDELVDACLL